MCIEFQEINFGVMTDRSNHLRGHEVHYIDRLLI